jgi:N-acetylglucosamine-6-phosphate deacetylase
VTGFAITGARIFDGDRFHDDAALIVEDGRVAAIVPHAGSRGPTIDAGGLTLAPGFIDWQVNGGGGALLNADPSIPTIRAIATAHARFGTTALLPTLITDTPQATRATRAAIATALSEGVPGVVGVHFEGPHLTLARKGAHDPALIRPMTRADRDLLTAPAGGVTLTTLAPENASPDDIRALAAAGVIVSLGHSDAGFDRAMQAFDAGARAVTHLFNAMSPLGHRAPGLVGAALDHPDVWCGLIADGWHVHPAAIRAALRSKPGRITLVTDAMPTVGWDGAAFALNGREVRRVDGRLTLEDGTLAGSDLDMASAVRFMVRQVGADLADALRMASRHPAKLLGLTTRGHLHPGARADIVALDAGLHARRVWIGGVEV